MFKRVLLMGGWVIGLIPMANATPVIGVDYTSVASSACNQNCVDGYKFTVTSTITVTALGVFDGSQGNPSNGGAVANISPSDTVDLYSSVGTLLATAAVGTSGTQVGRFWDFATISSVVLAPGNYIVVSNIVNGDQDASSTPESVSIGASITFDNEEYCNNSSHNGSSCSLSLSSLVVGDTHSVNSALGGNIEYTLGGGGGAIPEPASLAVFGLALTGLRIVRRQPRKASI